MKKILGIAMILSLAAGTAVADDLNPPEWRDWPGTVYAEWTFPEWNNQAQPACEWDANCYGQGLGGPIEPVGSSSADVMWETDYEGRAGVIVNNGSSVESVDFELPNCIDQEPWKEIWIQIVTTTPDCPVITSDPQSDITGTTTEPLANGWYYHHQGRYMEPNPDWELVSVFLEPGAYIDQIVFDTYSAPEPATMAVLGLGALGVLIRRRRKEA